MSVRAIEYVLDRLFKDPGLFHKYVSDPYRTLAAFELTSRETEAIISGNREQLIAVGIDERVAGWIPRIQVGKPGGKSVWAK